MEGETREFLFNGHRVSVMQDENFQRSFLQMSISLTRLSWTFKTLLKGRFHVMFLTTVKKRGRERDYLIQLLLQMEKFKLGKRK